MKKTDYFQICSEKLQWLGYAERTQQVYMHYINQFLDQVTVAPSKLTSEHFQDYLNQYHFSSRSQQNQIINAIKFLYEKGLKRKYGKVCFKRPKEEKRLPRVIDHQHIMRAIESIRNVKHKAIIVLAYSVGLRVSEVINLKIDSIDSDRMQIHIKQAKGRKDRIVPLSQYVLNLLRVYYKKYRPVIYLFNGQGLALRYSSTSCNKIVKRYLGEDFHFHLLRHSSFTHMMENGTDLRVIQKIAGHKHSTTTEIYTHVSNKLMQRVTLPV